MRRRTVRSVPGDAAARPQYSALTLAALLLLTGCPGGALPLTDGGAATGGDPFAPCVEYAKCCKEVVCDGDPDRPGACTCDGIWECEKTVDPKKCSRDTPVPPGGGSWQCSWTEFKYTCTTTIPPGGPPPTGGGDWNCVQKDDVGKWECSKSIPPSPPNTPNGSAVWKCHLEGSKLVCERPPTTPPDDALPPGTGSWSCTGPAGHQTCKRIDEPGLPPGGGGWKCHQVIGSGGKVVWVCVGDSPTPPRGGGGWVCVKFENELSTWRCEGPVDQPAPPAGGGTWICKKGSEFGGTTCEEVPPKKSKDLCAAGEKMWCDGLTYCGWGQVTCDPATGTWKKKIDSKTGKVELDAQGNPRLDCWELADGSRPNTVCACYHTFYNPQCCEQSNCIVPTGSKGQVCAPSKGGLCDYCNPAKPECKDPGARCIVTNAHETFCGRACSPAVPCPAGTICMPYKSGGVPTSQCVPADSSCYF